jgi:MYXO-CTERM domain-containing protein
VLAYDDHIGPLFYSDARSGGARYFALFRRPLSATEYRLYVAVNDTWEGDRDAQDGIYTMDIARPEVLTPTPGCVNCEPPPVGEPGTLALMGMVALGVARRMRRRA